MSEEIRSIQDTNMLSLLAENTSEVDRDWSEAASDALEASILGEEERVSVCNWLERVIWEKEPVSTVDCQEDKSIMDLFKTQHNFSTLIELWISVEPIIKGLARSSLKRNLSRMRSQLTSIPRERKHRAHYLVLFGDFFILAMAISLARSPLVSLPGLWILYVALWSLMEEAIHCFNLLLQNNALTYGATVYDKHVLHVLFSLLIFCSPWPMNNKLYPGSFTPTASRSVKQIQAMFVTINTKESRGKRAAHTSRTAGNECRV